MDKTFVTRTISGVLLFAVTLCMVVVGGPLLFAFVLAITLIGMYELYRVFQIEKTPLAIVGYLIAGAADLLLLLQNTPALREALRALPGIGDALSQTSSGILAIWTFGFLLLMMIYVFRYPSYRIEQITGGILGVFYVGFLMSFLYRTRMEADGAYGIWLIFISAWGSDTCAYLVGRKLGKHKMTPVLSPKKSVEGAIGGILGAALLGLLFGLVFQSQLTEFSQPPLFCMLIGACGSLLSMVGDLTASAIKRNYEIKDYGTLIPGHGGILDRFDSILFTAPVIFYLIQLLQG